MKGLPGSDPSGPELFSSDWAALLERELGASETYRTAAAAWKGSLAFVLLPDGSPGFPERRRVFLDLAHGNARAIRPALPGDVEGASYSLEGPASTWLRLLAGDLEPGAAILGGGLKLARGSMFTLFPHLRAAQELLACARRVPFTRPSSRALAQ